MKNYRRAILVNKKIFAQLFKQELALKAMSTQTFLQWLIVGDFLLASTILVNKN